MKVFLIDFTGHGHSDPGRFAAAMLATAKNTRINLSHGTLQAMLELPSKKLMEELDYIARTIPGSWEFVDYTFLIVGASRAFTHQLVRTRTASYAQQSMCVIDSDKLEVRMPPGAEDDPVAKPIWQNAVDVAKAACKALLASGMEQGEARGIMPVNTCSNIMAKLNLRTFVDLHKTRGSLRNGSEFLECVSQMEQSIALVHPWIEKFVARDQAKILEEMDDILVDSQATKEQRVNVHKLVDELRRKGL